MLPFLLHKVLLFFIEYPNNFQINIDARINREFVERAALNSWGMGKDREESRFGILMKTL